MFYPELFKQLEAVRRSVQELKRYRKALRRELSRALAATLAPDNQVPAL
jgi:hypothetical protein